MNTRLPNGANIAKNQIPVRIDMADGMGMWRGVKDLTDHAELCRLFNLDPVATSFDLPSSARAAGSVLSGYGGKRTGRISGYVLRHGVPVGKILVAEQGEKFWDIDPSDWRPNSDNWRLR